MKFLIQSNFHSVQKWKFKMQKDLEKKSHLLVVKIAKTKVNC